MTISINKETILDAQRAWGEGIVAISQTHRDGGDFTARAKEHINTLYAYGFADVLFKPTLAAEKQFRSTFDDALDYFIGKEGSEDSGFGIKGWTNVRWENAGITINGDVALAMGNYFFTGPDGSETKVEYSFGYILDRVGAPRIVLHHSSVPYSPE